MSLVVTSYRQIAAYDGPNALPGIRFRAARHALGVTAWGMNVLELDPHCESYPEHDHLADGQEEVYFVVEGNLFLRTSEGELSLSAGDMVRVPPDVRRKLVTKATGAIVFAIGATPGKPFVVTM